MNNQEAAQSISFVIYFKGVSMTITQRDPSIDMAKFIDDKKAEIDKLLQDPNFKPSWNPDTNKAVGQPMQKKIHAEQPKQPNSTTDWQDQGAGLVCKVCGSPATKKSGVSKTTGKQWFGVFCSTGDRNHTSWLRG